MTYKPLTDAQLQGMWRAAGGSFHGPRVETGTMPEALLLPFLRNLMTPTPQASPDVLGAAQGVLDALHACGDFDNGVTDPTGSINEGSVRGWEAVARLEAAIAAQQAAEPKP